MSQKRFVNLDQLLATFPFLKRSRVYYLTTLKRMPYYRVGRSLVFELGEVESWIEAGQVQPEAE
jgi:predicted DNA-binding transcriptional regulator AlpA